MEEFDLKKLAEAWPSPIVARNSIAKFSGGLLHPRTMANIDSRGEGPERLIVGRRVVYPVDSLIAWMKQRLWREAE